MEVIKILPKEVFKFHYDGDLSSLQEQTLQANIKVDEGRPLESSGLLMFKDIPYFVSEWKEIYDFMMDSVGQVMEHKNYQFKDFFMTQIWANIFVSNSQHRVAHHHSNSMWSSIFNVKSGGPTTTTFYYGDPELEMQTPFVNPAGVPTDYLEQRPDISANQLIYDPETEEHFGLGDSSKSCRITHSPGDFLVFRSNLQHGVSPFIKKDLFESRIILSANYWPNQMGIRGTFNYLKVKADYEEFVQKPNQDWCDDNPMNDEDSRKNVLHALNKKDKI